MEELSSGWENWKNTLDNAAAGSVDHSNALSELRGTMKKVLNTTEDLSDEFLLNTEN
jgi:hypothetical protein